MAEDEYASGRRARRLSLQGNRLAMTEGGNATGRRTRRLSVQGNHRAMAEDEYATGRRGASSRTRPGRPATPRSRPRTTA
jgi:hypothetical protein